MDDRDLGVVGSGLLAPELDSVTPSWQDEMKLAYRDATQLCAELGLPESLRQQVALRFSEFPLFAPRPFVARMKYGDPADPLLRQVLPLAAEQSPVPGFTPDPVHDLPAQTTPGVLQKYQGRALLITAGACAIHCRYCFRRHFPYDAAPQGLDQWQQTLRTLATDASLEELIFSGGDPWTLRDESWTERLRMALELPQLRRIRIHTRLPIVIPQRVTDNLVASLQDCRLPVVIVLHINHAQEIDSRVTIAVRRLRDSGATLLNQAVLLRGVNDALETQVDLSQALLDIGVLPY